MSITIGTHPNNLATWILSHVEHLQEPLSAAVGEVRWERYDDGRRTAALLASGGIDVGATGSTPPIVAQADGLDVVYLAASEPHPDRGGIVVPAAAPLHTLADLAGRRIAFALGSWQTHALAIALDRAGLRWSDVEVVDVAATAQGADFLAAGADAWLVVDPAFAQLEAAGPVRVLAATEELVRNRSVFWGRGDYAREQPAAVDAFVTALAETEAWASEHLDDVARLLSESPRGGDVETWRIALSRRGWGVNPVDDEFLAEQQHGADLFFSFGLIPREIAVTAAVATH